MERKYIINAYKKYGNRIRFDEKIGSYGLIASDKQQALNDFIRWALFTENWRNFYVFAHPVYKNDADALDRWEETHILLKRNKKGDS